MATPTLEADVALWHDWCQAAGVQPEHLTTSDIGRFIAATSHSRSMRYRRAAAIRHSLQLPPNKPLQPEPTDPSDRLASLPRVGWPAGLNRTRDAFIIAAAATGLTRAKVRELQTAHIDVTSDVPRIHGRAVATNQDVQRCAACATIDWLHIVAAATSGGRQETQLRVANLKQAHQHTIDDQRWMLAPQIVPGIDQHGWIDQSRPVSVRTITAALNREPEPVTVSTSAPPAALLHPDRTIDDLLDELTSAADTAYNRVAEVMRSVGLEPA